MDFQALLDYCLGKPGAYLDFPFGPEVACVKLCGRIVAQFFTLKGRATTTLKCVPDFGFIAQQLHPGVVVPGYHCPPVQRPHFITFAHDSGLPEDELRRMADHAYEAVHAKLTRKDKAALAQGDAGSR